MKTEYDQIEAEEFFAKKNAYTTGPVEVNRTLQGGARTVVVDVRAAEDYARGHVPGAVNLPEEYWSSCRGLQRGVPNIVYCYSQTCHLASRAAELFSREGYPVMEMEGGYQEWERNGLGVER